MHESSTSTPSKRYLLKTLGCKANLYDSQLLEADLQRRGWVPAQDGDESADLCIVNSCTVTDEADKQSRRAAVRLSRDHAGAKIVMTGCGAEVNPEAYAQSPGVDYVVGNGDKHRLLDLVLNAASEPSSKVIGGVMSYGEMISRHPMDREWAQPESLFMLPPPRHRGEAGRTRTFLKIQEGCNSFCTYCVIPYGRGPSRSTPIPQVIDQIRQLVEQGVREVVLTGTNLGDFGEDPTQLVQLLRGILAETELERLRISSLDPTEASSELIELVAAHPRLSPHFHISLQSPVTRILKLMKRKYGTPEVIRCLEEISRIPAPLGGPFVGMDVITGFPGETEEDFEEGFQLLSQLPWSRLHVFPYSERHGTPATRLPHSVYPHERAARAKRLRELSFQRLQTKTRETLVELKRTGRLLEKILIESPTRGPDGSEGWHGGYTPHYLRVLVPQATQNSLVSARAESLFMDPASGDVALIGRVVDRDSPRSSAS